MLDYENIIFDLDGTLVDSAPGIEKALLESIKLVLPEAMIQLPDIRAHIGPPLKELIEQVLPDASAEVVDQVAGKFRFIYDGNTWQKTVVYEHVVDTLAWLAEHGIDRFLVTNKRFQPTRQIIIELGLFEFFREVVTPDISDIAFPSKEAMVRYLIEKHSLNLKKTLLIGDTTSDAVAAQMCGVDFAVVTYGYGQVHQFNDIHPVSFIDRPDDLCRILGGGQVNE
jgi:phosphoglycolate phosphatase